MGWDWVYSNAASKKPLIYSNKYLIGEKKLLVVSYFLQVGDAGEVDHWWGAAHQRHRIFGRAKQMLAQHCLVYESCAILPA